jgi:hypothetical protein
MERNEFHNSRFRRLGRAGLVVMGSALALGLCAAQAQTQNTPRFQPPGVLIIWGADGFGSNANAPIVSDFVINSGSGNTAATSGDADLIQGDVHTVVTGSLTPTVNGTVSNNGVPFRVQRVGSGGFTTDFDGDGVLSAADGFGAFQIRGNSDINTRRAELETSFYVASNIAFSIDATATPIGATDDVAFGRMRLQMRVTQSGNDGIPFGSAAQFPHSGGAAGGIRANFRRLSTMRTPFNVFAGNQRTARVRGSIAQQSVRFDQTYRYNSGNIDLSDGVIDAAAEVVYTAYIP